MTLYMFALHPDNAIDYLASVGLCPDGSCQVESLGGGVSNAVLRVTGRDGSLVLKQPFARLRVAADWPATVRRAAHEADCLRLLTERMDVRCVPQLLHHDEHNHILVMEAVPQTHSMWKEELLAGRVRQPVARRVGELLGQMHRVTWGGGALGTAFDATEGFHQLRVDPYYLEVSRRHPRTAPAVDRLIEVMASNRHCLVHGDYSPKNLLVDGSPHGNPMIIDCEVAHRGDPTFDTAFLLNHLLLKLVHVRQAREQLAAAARAAWQAYGRVVVGTGASLDELEQRTLKHLALLQLARIDGKSPAEYIQAEDEKETVRSIGFGLLDRSVSSLDQAVGLALDRARALHAGGDA